MLRGQRLFCSMPSLAHSTQNQRSPSGIKNFLKYQLGVSSLTYKKALAVYYTKTYKKADKKQLSMMNEEAKAITKNLNIDDRVETTAMKDHKENFVNKPTCRLINPSKPEIGRISKQLLEKINRNLVNIKKVNHWKNTSSVLQWFDRLANKSDLAFICYRSIRTNITKFAKITFQTRKKRKQQQQKKKTALRYKAGITYPTYST